jgi:hypothetical protein
MTNNLQIFEFNPSRPRLFKRIITHVKQISGMFVKGQSSYNNILNEDISKGTTPTIIITKSPYGSYIAPLVNIYGEEIKEAWNLNYTISTTVKLNRFPSTVYTPDLKKLTKNNELEKDQIFYHKSFPITKKRTDLAVYHYGEHYISQNIIGYEKGVDENGNGIKIPIYENVVNEKPLGTIEFGAMAPYFQDAKKPSNLFSLCVYINLGKTRYSLYTDYKFKLGSINKIDFSIETIKPTDLENEKWIREIKLFVNGEQQEVVQYFGKVWNKHKKEIESGIIASSPNFGQYANAKRPPKGLEELKIHKSIIDYMEIPTDWLKFLNKIECSPIVSRHSKTLSSKDLPSLNNGVDFGPINIYSSTTEKDKEILPEYEKALPNEGASQDI